jgi:hypothetical protein
MHLFHFQAGQRLPRPRPATYPAYQRRGAGAHRDPGRAVRLGRLAWLLPVALFVTASVLMSSGPVLLGLLMYMAGLGSFVWVFVRTVLPRR